MIKVIHIISVYFEINLTIIMFPYIKKYENINVIYTKIRIIYFKVFNYKRNNSLYVIT